MFRRREREAPRKGSNTRCPALTFEKAMLVAKLKGARDRKRRSTGKKVEGRKSHKEAHPEVAALARSACPSGQAQDVSTGHFGRPGGGQPPQPQRQATLPRGRSPEAERGGNSFGG
jgi:hypothetical protein